MQVDGIDVPGTVPNPNAQRDYLWVELLPSDANCEGPIDRLYFPPGAPQPADGGCSLHFLQALLPDGTTYCCITFNDDLAAHRRAWECYCAASGRRWGEFDVQQFRRSDGELFPLARCIIARNRPDHAILAAAEPFQWIRRKPTPLPELAPIIGRLLKLRTQEAGCNEVVEEFAIDTDEDAHDNSEQEEAWGRPYALYQRLRNELSLVWRQHRISLSAQPDHPVYRNWCRWTGIVFQELAAWRINKQLHLFLAIVHEDRELPAQIVAGLTTLPG